MAQQTTTKIQFPTDFKISELLGKLAVGDKLLAACDVLKLNPSSYMHLDNGRRAMCAGNLLRGAARKDDGVVVVLESIIAESYKMVEPKAKKTRKPAPTPAPIADMMHSAMNNMVRGKKPLDETTAEEIVERAIADAEADHHQKPKRGGVKQSDEEAWDQMVDKKMAAKVDGGVSWAGKNPRFRFAIVKASGEVIYKYTSPATVEAGDTVIERA